jgi:hypothetical protein
VTRSTEAGVRRRHHRAVRALIYHLSAVVAGSSGDDGRARHQGRAYDYPPVGDARRPRIREALEPVLASRRHLVAGRRAVYLYPRRVGTISIEPSTSRARPSAIGAVISRGRPNGRWHSHRGSIETKRPCRDRNIPCCTRTCSLNKLVNKCVSNPLTRSAFRAKLIMYIYVRCGMFSQV